MARQPRSAAKKKAATPRAGAAKTPIPKKAAAGKPAAAKPVVKKPATGQTDPEVSVEDLLKAVNEASAQARNMWLSFLAFITYLVVALASITDKGLLLNEPIKLPIINVEISIIAFFVFGPILLLV